MHALASAEAPYMEIWFISFPTAVGEKEGRTVLYVDNALDRLQKKIFLNDWNRKKKFKTYERREEKILLKKIKCYLEGKALSQNNVFLTGSKQEKFSC